MAEGALSGANLARAQKWAESKGAKKKEEDAGILGAVSQGLSFINPLDLAAKGITGDINAKAADKLAGTDNVVAKNVGGAAAFFDPTKIVPALAGGALKTGLEVARLPTSLAATAYAGTTGQAAPGTSEDSPLNFLVNTEYIKNLAKDEPLANKLLANIQAGSPIIGNIGQAGGETVGRVTRESQSGVSRLPGGPEFRTAEELSRGTGLEGRTYGELAREGEMGAALLGDILSAAPVARGLAGAGARAGILSDAAAGRVVSATRAAEAAPLAPISVPLKGAYKAFGRAAQAETTFPQLAGMAERPGALGGVARTVEAGAQAVGEVWQRTDFRGRGLQRQAELTQEARPALTKLEEDMAIHDPSSIEYADLKAQRQAIIDDIEQRAQTEVAAQIREEGERKARTTATQERGEGFNVQKALEEATARQRAALLEGTAKTAEQAAAEGTGGKFFAVPRVGRGRIGDEGAVSAATPEATPAPAPKSYQQRFNEIDEQQAATRPGTPEHEALSQQRRALEEELDIEAEAEAMFEVGKAAKAAEKEGTPVIGRQEIPRGYDDANIEKAFKGLKPAEANNFATKAFDAVTKTWKAGVLPLNPAWQFGNIVSNSVTAMTYGDVSPVTAAKNHKRVIEQMKNPTEGGGAVIGAGQAGQFDAVAGKGKAAKVQQKAYDANQWVDDYGHMQVYINKLDQLKAAGLDDAAAKAQATDFTLKTMGDFGNMSHFERNVIRRAVPFYAWSKHSAKMSLREAALRPEKITQTATKAHFAGGRDERGPGTEFLEGQMGLGGGRFLRLPGGMEQGAPGGLMENPLTNPLKLAGGLNPLAQLPLAAAGWNPRAGRELTKAPGQSFASGALGYGINQIPLIRTAADLAERSPVGGRGENVIKGDTRSAVLAGGRPIAESKEDITPLLPAPLLRFLTGAQVDKPDVEGSKKRAEESEKKDTKSAKRYNKGAARKPKKNN